MYLKDELLPRVQEFSDLIDSYKKQNLEVRECIRKFDETISHKASKCAIKVLHETIGSEFIRIENLHEMKVMMRKHSVDIETAKYRL